MKIATLLAVPVVLLLGVPPSTSLAAGTPCTLTGQGGWVQIPVGSTTGQKEPVRGAMVVAVLADKKTVLGRTVTDGSGRWKMAVQLTTADDVYFDIAGYGLVGKDTYDFNSGGLGGSGTTGASSCGEGNTIEFASREADGMPIGSLELPIPGKPTKQKKPRPKAKAKPSKGKKGGKFKLEAGPFRKREKVLAVERQPDGTADSKNLHANRMGDISLTVTGGQLAGDYQWCFWGRSSGARACAQYTVG